MPSTWLADTSAALAREGWEVYRPDDATVWWLPPDETVPAVVVYDGADGLTYRFDQPRPTYPLGCPDLRGALSDLLLKGSSL